MDLQKEDDLFEQWWENHGQFKRAGGGDYEKTFAWEGWIAAKAQAVPEWISVENNLPDFGVLVLATNMKFKEGKFWWVFERCDSDDGWVWSRFESCLNEAYCDDYEITHWMPLPDALQEQSHV